ncbi:CBL-interacting serine/threonine-protein kinase 1-like isoform X3 [Hibiscus syriacus]|uniref:CBL-interacting serine/threonine-protein kinase 1-like isoform X3 n=1 Tax=Hibiscus syriacus TaxID=106335 RepID=UPI001920608F|nr:CBL-interacting serine/threonine-protein kinase 1-like isoform X3 [Hibiscus syriacus]
MGIERTEEKNNKKKKGILQLGNYELGRNLGEGNFGKVKLAKNLHSGLPFAVKILEKSRLIQLNIADQIKREIATLKLLKHPNVVRLHELENVLIDAKGNIKISDFGLSALPQHIREDGLLHTTCGSPNYVAPEILANRGYDGATSDIWSCGVILYVILTGYLPFDDRNLAVLYQKIFKGDPPIPKWLSPGARNMIRRILDPNPETRITMAGIKEDGWFKQDYTPAIPDDDDDEDIYIDDEAFSMCEVGCDGRSQESPSFINAFQLIGMSSCLDLSGFFEKEDVSERKIRFTSNLSGNDLLARIQDTVTEMGFRVQMRNGKLKATQEPRGQKRLGSLSVAAEVFEISPSLYVVELRKSHGDPTIYRQLCTKLANDLGIPQGHALVSTEA